MKVRVLIWIVDRMQPLNREARNPPPQGWRYYPWAWAMHELLRLSNRAVREASEKGGTAG